MIHFIIPKKYLFNELKLSKMYTRIPPLDVGEWERKAKGEAADDKTKGGIFGFDSSIHKFRFLPCLSTQIESEVQIPRFPTAFIIIIPKNENGLLALF